jgi:hypothetical protein
MKRKNSEENIETIVKKTRKNHEDDISTIELGEKKYVKEFYF